MDKKKEIKENEVRQLIQTLKAKNDSLIAVGIAQDHNTAYAEYMDLRKLARETSARVLLEAPIHITQDPEYRFTGEKPWPGELIVRDHVSAHNGKTYIRCHVDIELPDERTGNGAPPPAST